MLQTQHLLRSNLPISLSPPQTHFLFPPNLSSSPLHFLHKPINHVSLSAHSTPRPDQWLAEVPEPSAGTGTYTIPDEEGPIEILDSDSPVFATSDDPSFIQTATSVLLTGAITVFLFRSLRRRARRAKELKFRSNGAKKSLKEEALDSLKVMASGSVESKTPSPVQALLGGISAGVIALILYKFTTTIEASLNRQTISDNFSVRQITITIRTIINGLCYLATFVFGINAVGLVLYAGQIFINDEFKSKETENQSNDQSGSPTSMVESPTDSAVDSSKGDQSSDEPQ
ncbi:hypothetical protein RchiOBHm_Chr5g0032261 [Rosa chinensis]|uniref:Transmembrane protein n=1 Tax=Rosa chinensis TaxID=74649 RepID=A0A2P6QAD2_ROSCH|nr:uncharacterized protein LOC112202144 isoform X1 [Rosa chinensis]PRQ31145.1 hypothetical protein RchiOBHm_Chr5g0032261 [Rosa chinensis]